MSKDKKAKISVIVPVFNNQTTIRRVISVLLSCSFINQVIAVDDGSSDSSLKILKSFKDKKLQVFPLPFNHGKGAAIEKALDLVKNPVIMIVDADLSKLRKKHIINLRRSFIDSNADMVIAARKGKINFNPIDYLSGERIFFKKNIEPVRFLLKKVNNGFEQVVNFAHRKKKIKLIYSYDIGHILKLQRYKGRESYKIPITYLKEGWDISKTVLLLRAYSLKKLFFHNFLF